MNGENDPGTAESSVNHGDVLVMRQGSQLDSLHGLKRASKNWRGGRKLTLISHMHDSHAGNTTKNATVNPNPSLKGDFGCVFILKFLQRLLCQCSALENGVA